MTEAAQEDIEPEPYEQWSARMDAWLASLPKGHPVLSMDEIKQCMAFSTQDETK